MNNLPFELQALIVSKADVPIDTYLHYKKYGAVPKKLPIENYDYINNIIIMRVKFYKSKKITQSMHLYWKSKVLLNKKSFAMCIDVHNDIVKMSFRIFELIDNELVNISKTVVDVHTGDAAENWFDNDL
jgi:hypothetical protein